MEDESCKTEDDVYEFQDDTSSDIAPLRKKEEETKQEGNVEEANETGQNNLNTAIEPESWAVEKVSERPSSNRTPWGNSPETTVIISEYGFSMSIKSHQIVFKLSPKRRKNAAVA